MKIQMCSVEHYIIPACRNTLSTPKRNRHFLTFYPHCLQINQKIKSRCHEIIQSVYIYNVVLMEHRGTLWNIYLFTTNQYIYLK
jgi:hypothetical protein